MFVDVSKEVKNHEYRVGLTPPSVREPVAHGHKDKYRRVRTLEEALLKPEVRRDAAFVDAALHPLFRGFGRSGRVYNRAATVTEMSKEEQSAEIWTQDFKIQAVDICTVLVTYRSARLTEQGQLKRHANRLSLWVFTSQGWQILFHQGTPTGAFRKKYLQSRQFGRHGKR
jgi:hypothetical protein